MALSDYDDQFARAEAKDGPDFFDPPVGTYPVMISNVSWQVSKTTGNDMLVTELVMMTGPDQGSTFRKFTKVPGNFERLKFELNLLGINRERLSQVTEFELGMLEGKTLKINVTKNTKGDGVWVNFVKLVTPNAEKPQANEFATKASEVPFDIPDKEEGDIDF